MPWKMKDNNLVIENGNPVWVDDAGAEKAIDGGQVLGKITQLNSEAAANRRDLEAANTKLKAFGDLDPVAAKDAVEKVAKIDQGQLIAAGKVDEVKAQITAQFKAQNETLAKQNETLAGQLKTALIGNAFANSPAIKDKFTIGPESLQRLFGGNFDVENGKIVARDASGNVMKSTKKFGEDMDFDEAFSAIIETFPDKNNILRGNNHNGTGGTGGGAAGNKLRVTRSQEAAMKPQERVALMTQVRKGEAELVDD